MATTMKREPSRGPSPTPTTSAGTDNSKTDSHRPISPFVPSIDYTLAFKTHFDEFYRYLQAYLARVPSNTRLTARQKLIRLTTEQFYKVSTDVYDELERRKSEKAVPFLPVRSSTYFEELSSDIYYELVRRYPEFRVDVAGDVPTDDDLKLSAHLPTALTNDVTASYNPVEDVNVPAAPSIDYKLACKTHFDDLSDYLAEYLAKKSPGFRATARQKLTRLTIQQFYELSTDVHDELARRKNETGVPFLPIRMDYHPKRNQARQKLAALPAARFQDLSSDVHFEMSRRYPGFKEDLAGDRISSSAADRVQRKAALATNLETAASSRRQNEPVDLTRRAYFTQGYWISTYENIGSKKKPLFTRESSILMEEFQRVR